MDTLDRLSRLGRHFGQQPFQVETALDVSAVIRHRYFFGEVERDIARRCFGPAHVGEKFVTRDGVHPSLSRQLPAYFKGHLIRINRGPVEAEDLVQEALLAIHTRRHTYDRSQPFTPDKQRRRLSRTK